MESWCGSKHIMKVYHNIKFILINIQYIDNLIGYVVDLSSYIHTQFRYEVNDRMYLRFLSLIRK